MKKSFSRLLVMAVLTYLPASGADPETNCPAAFRPYSADTTLLDLLINPATKAIVQRDLAGLLEGMPKMLTGATPPTLADVLTIRIISSEFMQVPEATLTKLNKDLAEVPNTRESAVARCARYDHVPPTLPEKIEHPAVLVFSKSNGFRDDPSVNAGLALLKEIGERHHYGMVFTENAAVFNAKDLKRFDAVVWNNVSGDVLTVQQREDFKNYVLHGGGFAGFHGSGGDPYYDWDWYADTLIGARFLSHPMSPQFQDAKVKVDDSHDSIVSGLPAEWTMADEWYSFKSDPRAKGAHVLATLDESTYHPMRGKTDLRMGDHPIAWTQCLGNGRSFYSAIGHRPESYSEPNAKKLMEAGVVWATGQGASSCRGGKEVNAKLGR